MDQDDHPSQNEMDASSPSPLAYYYPPTTGVVYSTKVNDHFNLFEDHYECPDRILRTWTLITQDGVDKRMKMLPIRPVHKNEAMLVHTEEQWNTIQDMENLSEEQLTNSRVYYESLSLYVNNATTKAALLSCGGVIEACLAVANDESEIRKAFAIVRPPGHHSEPSQPMGFCFFNNVAVACRVVQQETRVKRILIVDWDVHHGNGTQKAFEDDADILYISLHRYDGGQFYPGGTYGGMHSCGEGDGLGYSVNIPWPQAGMGDAEYIHAFQSIVLPIAMEFAPQLVIISAGFDAAEGDPLGGCKVTPTGYAHMTHMLSGLAGGRLVVALEGGYNVESVAQSALAVAKILVMESPPELPPLRVNEIGTETVWLVAKQQSRYWNSISPQACTPRAEFREDDTVSIPEILKIYRQNYLSDRGMMQVPLLDGDMQDRFGAQVICTANILEKDTLVFFMHEFGNIQAELESAANCSLDVERTYLIDFSRDIMSWVTSQGYGLLDVNLYPRPLSLDDVVMKPAKLNSLLTKEIVVYLWDNFV
ncbi:hypothetical protein BDZ89DRAFT_1074786, partial [Hymenopellis radicata]